MAEWTKSQNSMVTFIEDHNSITRGGGIQIDWSRVPNSYKLGMKYIVKANGAALAAATSVTVDTLPVALPIGTELNFTGTGEVAILTAPALAGATTIAVEALDAAIEDNDEATYLVSQSGAKSIAAGTIMAALSSGLCVPRAASGADTAVCLLASNAVEGQPYNGLSGWGNLLGGVVYNNLLPDFGHASLATWKGELQTAGVGTGFAYRTYADNRS